MAFSDQGSSDNKQYLNLSMEAWKIIEYDRCRFASTESSGNKLPLSTFLNRIFLNFYEAADASIALQADNYARELREILSDGEDRSGIKKRRVSSADSMDTSIEKLTLSYVERLQKKSESYKKGKGEKFRLNNENFIYLTDPGSDCQENLYYTSIGQYLKALFEEYAALMHLQREAIYYRPLLETIQQAFDSNLAVRVTHVNGHQFEFQPYKVLCDPTYTHHYLAGYSTPLNVEIDYDTTFQPVPCRPRPASMRISNICDAKLVRRKSGKLTAKQKIELETLLSSNGSQFLADDTQEILVRLTPEGIKKYNYRLNLRPGYAEIIEPDIYVFRCSERQIEYYFFNFGKDAVILKPDRLRQYFRKLYEDAAKAYEN